MSTLAYHLCVSLLLVLGYNNASCYLILLFHSVFVAGNYFLKNQKSHHRRRFLIC